MYDGFASARVVGLHRTGHACLHLPMAAGALVVLGLVGSCPQVRAPVEMPTPPNFHVVDPGRLYRSGQPGPEGLAHVIEHFGIKTILNLRGTNEDKVWYRKERAVAEAHGVTLCDQRMSAHSLPSGRRLRAILHILETGEYPILVHCQGGSDRSGAISAIYRMAFLGHGRSEALTELSPAKLHFRWYAPCMDVLAERFEPTEAWLAEYSRTYEDIECEP